MSDMMNAEAAEEAAEEVAVPSLPKRLVDVFVKPGELFETLARRPVWGGALALGAVIAIVGALLIPTEMWVEMSRAQMVARGQEVPEGFANIGGTFARIMAVVGGLVGWPIFILITSGVVTLAFSFIMGDEGRFKQYLSVTTHAMLIAAVGGLVMVPLRIAQGNPVLTLSVGTFFGVSEGYLARFLLGLDLFMLWSYAVVAVGVTRVDTRRSYASALFVTAVIVIGLTALFSLIPRPAG